MSRFQGPEGEPAKEPAKKQSRFAGPEDRRIPQTLAKQKPREMTWGEAVKGGLRNAKESGEKFLTGVRDAYIADPYQFIGKTAPDAIFGTGAAVPGVARDLAGGAYLNQLDPKSREALAAQSPAMQNAMRMAGAVRDDYANRWGGTANIKQAIHDHPYAMAADVASVLPAVGAAGRVAGTVASKAIPAAAKTAAKGVVNAMASKVPGPVKGVAAGVGAGAKHAANAARYVAVPTHAINDFVGPGVQVAARAAHSVADPRHAAVGRITGGVERAREMRNALAAGREIVPGSKPTPSQIVAPNMPAAKLAAAEKTAAGRLPDEFTAARGAQNDALLAHIDSLAELPVKGRERIPFDQRISEMEALMKADDARLYGASDPIMSKTNERFFEILNLPENDDILARAARLAKQKEVPFGQGRYVPEHTVSDPYGQWAVPDTRVAAEYPSYSGKELQFIKEAFDELAFERRMNLAKPATKQELAAIRAARQKFLDWVETDGGNPHLNIARAKHAENAQRKAQMEYARIMRSKLTNIPSGDDALKLTSQQFRTALDTPMNDVLGNSNVNRTTGRSYYESARELLGDEQYAKLEAIRDDLARRAIAEEQALAGSREHAGLIKNAFSDSLHVRPDNMLMRWAVSGRNNSVYDALSNSLLTPESTLAEIDNYLLKESGIKGLDMATRAMVSPWRLANKYPTLYNAYGAAKEDQQKAPNR